MSTNSIIFGMSQKTLLVPQQGFQKYFSYQKIAWLTKNPGLGT